MSSEAVWEAALLIIAASALGLMHFWNYTRSASRMRAAEEALRLDAIRQEAVTPARDQSTASGRFRHKAAACEQSPPQRVARPSRFVAEIARPLRRADGFRSCDMGKPGADMERVMSIPTSRVEPLEGR